MPAKHANPRSVSLEYPLLGLLLETPAHGYELTRLLSQQLGMLYHVNQSQVYATLERMLARGWVVCQVLEQEKKPARKRFSLTEAGKQHLKTWLYAVSRPSVQVIRLELPARLFLLNRSDPAAIPGSIDAQAAEIAATLAGLRPQLEALPEEQLYNRIALDLRIQQLEATLDWLENLRLTFI